MFDKLLELFRSESGFALMSVVNVLTSVLGAVFYLYFAAIVSIQDYGKVNYVISFALTAYAISSMGMDTTIMTFVPKIGRRILFECYSIILISTVTVSLVTGILFREFTASIMIFSVMAYSISLVELVTLSRYKEYTMLSLGSKISQICLSLSFFYWIGLDGFLLGYSISYLIFGYRFLLGLKNFSLNFHELRGKWRFVMQVYGAGTSYTLLSYLDKIVVGLVFDYFLLGSYQLSFQVFTFLSILPHTLFNYLLPHQARGLHKKRIKILGFTLICGIVLLAVLTIPVALPYAFPKYTHVVTAIQIMAFAIIPLTLVSFLRSNILAETKQTASMLYAGLISLTTEIVSIIVLGSLFGINGVSSALLLTMTIEFIFLLIANRGRLF